ncbi:aromatic amino acid lyase [Actinoplanes sp. NPDC051851]|uniref:aromatic amino acid lyase n=1 Tax=Actinoplanes sp. NPDC051851 TaxID=3154753 RepID=UPI003427953F
MIVERPEDLGPALIRRIAREGTRFELDPALLGALKVSRAAVIADLAGGQAVYGVNTGMGALAGIRLSAAEQGRHQNTLMAGRAVGSAPWLPADEARAMLAVRLRTFLDPAAGVSPELCQHLVAMLNGGVVPEIPARGSGAAGEIIPLAHLGLAVLERTGFGPKEGVAFLEGVPGLTGRASLFAGDARLLLDQVLRVAAASHDVIGASGDPSHPGLGAGDAELRTVNAELRRLRRAREGRALQAPVSFRVTAPALAVAARATAGVEQAVDRALTAITDSPAHLDGGFVGTAGFAGTDLVAAVDALVAALTHVAELGAARLHRLLDDRLTGLPRQLSDTPGAHAGMVAVHKRAVGVVHRMRRFATPSLAGSMETSLGQEDVQSFGFEAVECLSEVLDGLRDVTACELLAVHQAALLAPALPLDGAFKAIFPDKTSEGGPTATADRPFGRDIARLIERLRSSPW